MTTGVLLKVSWPLSTLLLEDKLLLMDQPKVGDLEELSEKASSQVPPVLLKPSDLLSQNSTVNLPEWLSESQLLTYLLLTWLLDLEKELLMMKFLKKLKKLLKVKWKVTWDGLTTNSFLLTSWLTQPVPHSITTLASKCLQNSSNLFLGMITNTVILTE